LESELFGHEKGAFTGASGSKRGKFELAGKGTIFLDEIGEIPIELQSKLLRFIQEKEFERLGGERKIKSDARVIAATNKDLREMVTQGTFIEKEYIIGTLHRTHWHLGKTCELLGISRPTLRHKLKTYGLTKDFKPC
jgi:transcriptional regulator with GAF, ATPase, and Fis domain